MGAAPTIHRRPTRGERASSLEEDTKDTDIKKTPKIIGIDPGIGGAIVILNENGEIERAERTPILIDNGKKQYDIPGMRNLILGPTKKDPVGEALVGIEKVHTLPRDGRVGAFRFGVGYGIWLGLLSGTFTRYVEVTPQRWQGRMLAGLPRGPHTKMSAVQAAKSLFPNIPIGVKADWGIADAALIAEYTRRQHLGKH